MIYSGNHTVTTAKSASYLGNVGYKCSDYYSPEADGAVHWDSCGIDWDISGAPVLSEKDAAAPALADFDSPFVWEGEV